MAETYPIVPADPKWLLAVLVPILIVLIVAGAFLTLSFWGSQRSRVEVDEAGIRLHGDMYGRFIPRAALRTKEVRAVDLDREPALQPASRRFGTGLPGYSSGWFRLQNGEKALVYLTDRSRVVYIPTTQGFSVLVSTDKPERLVAALR